MSNETQTKKIYLAFWFYKLGWRFHNLTQQEQSTRKRDFLTKLNRKPESVTLRGIYGFAGLRADADLMIWTLGPDLDGLRSFAIDIRHSSLGEYLREVETYIGVTTPPRYDPEHQPAFAFGTPPKKFASIYPFVKTSEWYLLSREERGRLMAEHGKVGRQYAVPRDVLIANARQRNARGGESTSTATLAPPAVEGGGVLSNTVDAFGLGDYEFILANESDDPSEIVAMMMALRATDVRRYTKLDTPIYFGRLRTPEEALEEL